MAHYEVQAPDGKTVVLEGPDGASEADIIAKAKELYKPAASANKPSGVGAFLRNFGQGTLMNFGDEVAGTINAVLPSGGNPNVKSIWDGVPFAEAVRANAAAANRVLQRDQEQRPVASGTGRVAGAVGGSVVGGGLAARAATRAVPGATALARATNGVRALGPSAAVVPGAAAAAGFGAVSGFGEGETLDERVQGARTGGYVGAVVGAPLAAGIAGFGPAVAKYVRAFAGKGITEQALNQINRALRRDGYDVTTAQGKAALEAELAKYGSKPVALADVGAGIRTRTGIGLRTPSRAQNQSIDAVMDRQAGQGQRLERDVLATVAPRADVHALDEKIVEQRAATALPARAEAMATEVDQGAPVTPAEVQRWVDRPEVRAWLDQGGTGPAPAGALVRPPSLPVIPQDEVLQNIARLPAARNAIKGARELADNERQLLTVQGKDTSHLPDFPEDEAAPLDMKALDYIKRHLDGEVNRAFSSSDSAVRATAPGLRDLRDALRDRMRTAVPKYGEYLDAYGDASEMREALAAGRGGADPSGRGTLPGFDRLDPEVIAAEQANRSVPAQELYRVGAARNLLDKIRKVSDGGTPATRILNTPLARDQLRATGVRPEDATRLETAVAQERNLGQLTAELRGSQTDARLAARADAEGLSGATPFNPTSAASWLAFIARHAAGAIDLRRNASINEALLPRVLATDPAVIQKVILELTAAGHAREAAILARAARARTAAGAYGAVIGAPLTTREDQ